MKKFYAILVLIILCLLPNTTIAAVYLDIASATFTATGPQTLNGANVDALAADGAIYNCTFEWNPNTLNWVLTSYYISGYKDDDAELTNAKKLLGTWYFGYTIGSTYFDQTYKMHTIDSSSDPTNSEGGYWVWGDDEYGNKNEILACHWPDSGYYTLLDPGTIIHRYFVFQINGNSASGSYYQVDPDTMSMSSGYSFSGTKTGTNSSETTFERASAAPAIGEFIEIIEKEKVQSEIDPNSPAPKIDSNIIDMYESMRQKSLESK